VRSSIVAALGLVVVLGYWTAHSAQRASAQAQRPATQPPRQPQPAPQQGLDTMSVVGYGDHLSVQPGETIKFMVSSQAPQYRADIVRIIMGDINPRGPGLKETIVNTAANGDYPGKRQPLPLGSYVTVPDNPALRLTGSFTLTAWIAPTTHDALVSAPPLGAQGVLTKWAGAESAGFGLFIDEGEHLSLWLGDKAHGTEKVQAEPALRPWVPMIPGAARFPRPQGVTTSWYFIAASFDSATGRVVLYQQPLTEFAFDPTRAVVERTTSIRTLPATSVPFLMAAYETGRGQVGGHYNGKIEAPRVYSRALSTREMEAVGQGRGPADVVAAWDFSLDIPTSKVTDTGSHKLQGQTVNVPTRAVTGHNWTGREMDYTHAREQYGAIYFHDDDLEDARWDVGFEFKVPDNLKSGVYAARLRTQTSEDYVPFFVRPRKGTTTARIALLIPTFSYLAYGSTGTPGQQPLSNYSRHTDGSGVTYSSRLRPITNMRPKVTTRNPWQFMADTHLVDWLEVKGFTVDVITDQDLHFEGASLLAPYKVVLTGTHPEYYSQQMLDAVRGYLDKGGRLMYMGGNGFYWVTPMDPSGRYIELRRRDGTEHWQAAPGESYHSLTGEPGGLWRFRGLAPQALVGVGFTAQGFDKNSPYKRLPGSFDPRASFIFEGIGRDEVIGDFPSLVLDVGAAGSELDRADYALGTPPHTLVLAESFGHSDAFQFVVEEVNTSDSLQGGSVNPLVHANLVYLEYPNGGGVFSTGSIAWCGSLSYNNYTNNVSRITENVLRRFASQEPLPVPAAPRSTTSAGQP
jgi:N,N-dimethylformamidase